MKTLPLVSLITAVCSTLASAADNDPAATKQLQVYPKNLARQHLGANLFLFNAKNQAYVPTEAAAAWLDDDITTGWPALPGKQHYLIALPEPEMLSNFSLSSKPAGGTVRLYAGDEPAIPGAKSWSPLTAAVSVDSINEKPLAASFSRLAKYVLIETDIANPSPIYSVNLYGDKSASSYSVRKRARSIDSRSIFGQYVNQQTAFNLNGIYSQGRVSYSNSQDGFVAWQKGIDENPESSLTVASTTSESGAAVQYGAPQSVSRIALLADTTAKGTLDFFLVNDAPAAPTAPTEGAPKAVSLEGKTPTVSIVLDGSNARTGLNFPAVQASAMLVRWTPANGTDSINLHELESFGDLSLNDYEVSTNPQAVASHKGGSGKDAKEIAQGPNDPKDAKDGKALDPVAAGPAATGTPYLPGALGFPPNINAKVVGFSNTPVSP